jgi:hypothetical protein
LFLCPFLFHPFSVLFIRSLSFSSVLCPFLFHPFSVLFSILSLLLFHYLFPLAVQTHSPSLFTRLLPHFSLPFFFLSPSTPFPSHLLIPPSPHRFDPTSLSYPSSHLSLLPLSLPSPLLPFISSHLISSHVSSLLSSPLTLSLSCTNSSAGSTAPTIFFNPSNNPI